MVFITESGKEIQVPSDYTFQSLEKFAKEIYQQGKSDKYQEIISEYMLLTEKQVAEIRADAIEELLPFWNELEDMMLEWICDDLLGEFINPETDESWCSEHCGKCKKYECIKKWCELKEHKNGESNRD